MRSKIISKYPASTFVKLSSASIFVADFSERTGNARKVEVHTSIPSNPNDSTKKMDCLCFHNKRQLSLEFNVFNDHQFKNGLNKDVEHCECCFFCENKSDSTFVGFVEIKDCKPRNISEYKSKVKTQIINVVRIIRENHIVFDKQEIYGIISFPQKKTAYDQSIFSDYSEYKRLYKSEKIHFIPANDVYVIDDNTLNIKDI